MVGFYCATAECFSHTVDDHWESGPLAITSSLWISFGMAESVFHGTGQKINPGSTI